MIIGRNFVEKLYSENQKEKLYSTGNEELDNLLEKAFCDGYEYAQKEFAYKPPMKPEKIRETIKAANEAGIKGKGLAQISRTITQDMTKAFKENGITSREQIQKLIRQGNKASGLNKTSARRLQPGNISMIKSGLI